MSDNPILFNLDRIRGECEVVEPPFGFDYHNIYNVVMEYRNPHDKSVILECEITSVVFETWSEYVVTFTRADRSVFTIDRGLAISTYQEIVKVLK